jgi:hypothetical protein
MHATARAVCPPRRDSVHRHLSWVRKRTLWPGGIAPMRSIEQPGRETHQRP